uniref:Uncharacterized protein n=1 Tax=Cuerna arida TaxID=1464854 RepID=A0A1B6F7Y5_9HEMI
MAYAKATLKEKKVPKSNHSQGKKRGDQTKEQEAFHHFIRNIPNDGNPNRGPETRNPRPTYRKPPGVPNPQFPHEETKFGSSRNRFNIPILSKKLNFLKIKELTLEEKIEKIKLCLDKSQSPFMWKPKQAKPVDEPRIIIDRLEKKDKEISGEYTFKWRSFILHLIISYELFRAKEVTQALEKLKDLQNILTKQTNSASEEWLFISIKDALWHVITASKAFLLLNNNLIDEAYKLISEIQPIFTMKRASKAGIHGIRAAVFMEYGHRGNLIGLTEAMKAVEIDRTNGEWHFLVGKCMGRIRRVSQCFELVDPLEVKSFNEAINLDKINANYKVYLAQALRERAFREFKKEKPVHGSDLYKKFRKTYLASYHMLIEVREMQPNCPHLLVRCAFVMMKMPPDIIDLKFTRECVDKALELAPDNPMANHVKAMYYERYHVEAEVPLEYYEKAAALGNFGAAMDLVRMHYKLKQENIVEELERCAEIFEEPCKRREAYMQAGSYLLFIKKNLVEALKYYQKVIDMDPEYYALKFHKPMFFPLKEPVNMLEVLMEELEKHTEWRSFSPQDAKVLKTFLIKNRSLTTSAHEERLNVTKILEISRNCINRYETKSKKRIKRQNQPKNPKKWRGKGKGRGQKTNNKKQESVGQNNFSRESAQLAGKQWKTNTETDFARASHSKEKSLNCRERTSSVSSVDSDYCRDNMNLGPRSLFFNHCKNTQLESDQGGQNASNLAATKFFNKSRASSSCSSHSRDSHICSISSNESLDDTGHRYLQEASKQKYLSGGEENKLGLTVENLKKFDSQNTNDLRRQISAMSISSIGSDHDSESKKCHMERLDFMNTSELGRRMSILSISSAGSDKISDSKSLSVMERVKQSYRMLGHKRNSIQQNVNKTGNLNNQQNKKNDFATNKPKIHRSDSTQSLNIQQSDHKSRLLVGYRPAFHSRDSSVESSRSLLFMPSFGSKTSESDREN